MGWGLAERDSSSRARPVRVRGHPLPVWRGNDTESRHTNIKARAKYLPIDVPGHELRLLGAAMTMNAVAWQLHLQAHGEANVLDDTA